MVNLAIIQTQYLQGGHVRLNRYRPCPAYLQQARIVRKARVTIPTPGQLDTYGQHKKLKGEPFHELPEGTDVDAMDWEVAGLGNQPVLEVPGDVRGLLGAESKEWYTTTYTGNAAVWYAILFGLDPEFITRTQASQQRCVCELKQQMAIELDDYYQKHKYRQYGYMKSEMDRVLTQGDEYHTTLGHFLTDFLDVNVLVLLESRRFHWVGRFDEARVTLLVYHHGINWGALVHPDQSSHLLDPRRVKALTEKLGHMTTMDATQQHANLVMDAEVLAKLKRQIKGMKVKELQDRALQMELLLVDDNGKKKLKRDLQEEIYTQLTGCSDF